MWPNVSLMILDCPQLWQTLQAFDSFDSNSNLSTSVTSCGQLRLLLQAVNNFDSCCKLSTVLTAFTCYYQLWQLLQAVCSLHSSLMQLTALIAKKNANSFHCLKQAADALITIYKLSTPFTAFPSCWQVWQLKQPILIFTESATVNSFIFHQGRQ